MELCFKEEKKKENTYMNHVEVYLHLAKMERVSQIMGINHADANVTVCCHHSFHCYPCDSRIGRRPAKISTPPRCL